MTTNPIDVRLEAAIRPLVIERVPSSLVAELPRFGADVHARRGLFPMPRAVAVAMVLLVVLAATFALVWSSGEPMPHLTALEIARAAAKGAPLVQTADGPVYLRARPDGSRFELVLQPATGAPVVLASIAERELDGLWPSLSAYPVECPPATGLRQEKYLIGHANEVFGSVVLSGIRGQTAGVSQKLFLIAVDGGSIPKGSWSFAVAAPWGLGGGGTGNIWAGLIPGQRGVARSPVGCVYEDNTPPPAAASTPGAAATPANGPGASVPPPWWLTTAVTTCNAPAAYRLPDGSQRLGSCSGLLVDPPATVTVHVGDLVEIHMTERSPADGPFYAIPTSSDPAVLALDAATGNATAAFKAQSVGTAWLASSGQCLEIASNTEILGRCPVLAVVVSP